MNNVKDIVDYAHQIGITDQKYIQLLTNYASRLIENNVPIIYDTIHFSLLTGVSFQILEEINNKPEMYYTKFTIPKKDKSSRVIEAPKEELKLLQKMVLFNILNNVKTSKYCHGFKTGHSIISNAQGHVKKAVVYNLDLQDFFPSISYHRVKRVFKYLGYSNEVATCLTNICCLNNRLPQGAPTSPALSNIICLRLDKRLGKLAEAYNLTYTRYADDLSFSGSYIIKKLVPKIKLIINEEEFDINDKKERMLFSNMRQSVTGLIVNDKVSIPREYLNKLRQEIFLVKKLGPKKYNEFLIKIGCLESYKGNVRAYLYGKVFYINSVNPKIADKFFDLLSYVNWEDV